MADDGAFADLRRLSEWFEKAATSGLDGRRSLLALERLARRLGATAIPLLGRELRQVDSARREAARDALALLATTDARPRVIRALREVTVDRSVDEAKVCALGLLAELGEHAAARFRDPVAIQRRSALALAAQLDGPADVASAADLMLRQLPDDEIVQMVEILVEACPDKAELLVAELAGRLDIEPALRDRVQAAARALIPGAAPATSRLDRPTQVRVLVDAAARIVVIARRKIAGERRWRRWSVLIGATGCIEDCLHEDDAADAGDDRSGLVASLCADGYRIASTDREHARTLVTSAIRRTTRASRTLGSAYYLGRDLLELADAHVARPGRETSALGHAVELIARGELAAARTLLEQACDAAPAGPLAGALAACLLAQGDLAGALPHLERAVAAEPAWPLHHWNLAATLHRLGDARGCYHALRRFLAASASPSALVADAEQPGRVAWAERAVAELERSARLAGTSLTRPSRSRRPRSGRATATLKKPKRVRS